VRVLVRQFLPLLLVCFGCAGGEPPTGTSPIVESQDSRPTATPPSVVVRATLKKEVSERSERSQFVKVSEVQWALRSWEMEDSNGD
jgi:hypothetical protein